MPVDTGTLIAFALASLAVYLAPGPDMAYIGGTAMSRGMRSGIWAALGTTSGAALQALACAFGVSALFLASPILFEIVRWAGVAYLAYLGIRMLRAREAGAIADMPAQPPAVLMAKGAAINILNPKIALFFLAFLPQFADPARGAVSHQLLLLGGLFSFGALIWCLTQAVAFSYAGRLIAARPRVRLWQERMTGGIMLVFAGVLALSGARR